MRAGIDTVFGVVGSGNFDVTNAMVAAGARFVAARHETGAATMADAYARMSAAGVAAVTLHQGCGLTNALTGITEAAKSRTPLRRRHRRGDPAAVELLRRPARAGPGRRCGADAGRLRRGGAAAGRRGRRHRGAAAPHGAPQPPARRPGPPGRRPDRARLAGPAAAAGRAPADPQDVERLVDRPARRARRPVFVAGRGARGPGCRAALELLADRCGALLATSAVAKGLFAGNPWSLDVSGGFASPLAAELIGGADLVVGWGCTLNMWTMRHGRLIAPDATVVQVDVDADALGAHRELTFGVLGDVRRGRPRRSAEALGGERRRLPHRRSGARRSPPGCAGATSPSSPPTEPGRIDPRTLTIALDDLLPAERIVSVDSGNFMGYPSMFLDVPDEFGFCFTQAFQSVGLGLATAIGAALARPDRLPVAALGDGGLLMGAAELETVVRLGLPMVVIVYDDAAYGAEVHHFGPHGAPLDTVRFPDTDLAAVARGFGFDGVTVRGRDGPGGGGRLARRPARRRRC